MLTVYLGFYTFVLALLWGLFIVAKIHAYKFKNFSPNIEKITNLLFVFLITLSIVGYVMIFYSLSNTTTVVDEYYSSDVSEVNY